MSHRIQISGTDVEFMCEPDEFILDAALKAGIQMPYSCKKGVCGNCAARVETGHIERAVVSLDVVSQGQELLCQCRPKTDLLIQPSQWHRSLPEETKRLQLKVFRNTRVAPDVSLLYLRLPSGQRVKFRAGQYAEVVLPDGRRRSYSMANPPHESDSVQLHIRHVEGGYFSQIASKLEPGDLLEVELPFGQVHVSNNDHAPLLCVCGGTGFAPVKSLLDDLVRQKSQRKITLIWGSRDKAGLYLLEHIAKWQKALPNFNFRAAVENEIDANAMGAFQGRVDAAIKAMASDLECEEVYCCGSPIMVAAVKTVCLYVLKIEPAQFHADVFVSGPFTSTS
jgi:CDP-4-dehydro-6-deoxyglucose reductase/terephthalate 1,2-dioxygenase reductase component